MKITALEIENVKRIRAVRMEPSANGLTVIGGRNGQGKTSVLSAIAYAFGGEKFRPSNMKRDDSVGEAFIHIETDDGFVIERKGAKSALTVTDPSGMRGGQAILDRLVGKYAINLPKFMEADDREKAQLLLQVLGIGDELAKLDKEEKTKYDEREAVGRVMRQKQEAARELPYFEDAPEKPVSVSDLVREHEAILARNGENARKRLFLGKITDDVTRLRGEVQTLRDRLGNAERELAAKERDAETARKTAEELRDESTAEIERRIADFETVNAHVRANEKRLEVENEAAALSEQYETLTGEIGDVRKRRLSLLDGADLPYPGLTVEEGRLRLNGKAWDCMSGAMQLIVACSISLKLNPQCRMVLMDKLEQLDRETLEEFDRWLREHDIQAITTRVSTGEECTLIIEDGEVAEQAATAPLRGKKESEDMPDEY